MATRTGESRGGRLVSLMLLGLVALAGLAYVGLAWFIGGKVPHGTTVEGVDIGGLTPTAAEQRLRNELADRTNRAIVLTWHDRTFRVDPGSAGLAIDYTATVQEAGGSFSFDPGRIWRYFVGGDALGAHVTIADSSMEDQVARLDTAVHQDPVEGSITFDHGEAHPVLSRTGRRLDEAATRELIVHAFLHGGSAQLPVVPDPPYVDEAAVQQAMRDFARPAMSAPVVLLVGGQQVVVAPTRYSVALSMVPDGHQLRPVVDGDRLLAAIRPAMTTVGDRPRNARIILVDGRPTVIPARIGATFDVADLAARFPTYAAKPPGQRRMPVKAVVQQPRFTTADARGLGLDQVVAQATSRFPDRAGLSDAVQGAADGLEGRVVRPGQLLTVTAPAGSATTGPTAFASSQVASTLYTAAFAAGLEVVQRTALPTYHPAFGLGIDARVDADHQLQLRDDTRFGVMVAAEVQPARPRHPGSVTVTLWSTRSRDVTTRTGPREDVVPAPVRYDDSAGCRPTPGAEGFTVAVTRLLRAPGKRKVDQRQAFTSTYRPAPAVRCGGAPSGSSGGTATGPGTGPGNGHGGGNGGGPGGPPR